jgi:hypothetical protein
MRSGSTPRALSRRRFSCWATTAILGGGAWADGSAAAKESASDACARRGIPWDPVPEERYWCVAVPGATGPWPSTLEIVDEKGSVVFRRPGEELISIQPITITHRPPEDLLLTQWSSGMSFAAVILRCTGKAQVSELATIPSDGQDVLLFDVDGDSIDECFFWVQVETIGKPVADWPYEIRCMKWVKGGFQPFGRVCSSRFRAAVREILKPK